MKIIVAIAALGLMGSACGAGDPSLDGLDEGFGDPSLDASQEEVSSAGQAICSNQSGVASVMASLAVATAIEMRRWNAPVDFQWNSSKGMLEVSATGKARCYGVCRNVQALLDLQKPEAYLAITFPGGVKLDSYHLRSTLKDAYDRQVRCNNWWGEYTTNGCWVEAHDLWFDHTEKGVCADDNYFWRNKAGTNQGLDHPVRLNYQLYFAGYPHNEFLNFRVTNFGQVVIDPTAGLTEAATTTAGSCTAACTQFSKTSVVGACCSCNGLTKKFVKSGFSADLYLCK